MEGGVNSFKVCIIGPATAGKTAFVKRHATGEFGKDYVATMTPLVTPLRFYIASSSHPELPNCITLNMWDIGGIDVCGPTTISSMVDTDVVIAMFDIREKEAIVNHYLDSVPDNIPIILCSSKCDIKTNIYGFNANKCEKYGIIKTMRQRKLPYFPISSLSNYNFEKPILTAIRKMYNVEDIMLTESPELAIPPMIDISSFFI